MPLLLCHNCGAELATDSTGCSHCGSTSPFACAVCDEPISSLASIGWAHPFTKDGKPLCAAHAQRLCDACHKPFPQEVLIKRISRWDFFPSAGEYLQMPGYYCGNCNAAHADPAKPKVRSTQTRLLLGIVGLCVAVAILFLLLHTHR